MTRLLNLLIVPFLLMGCTPERDQIPVVWVKSPSDAKIGAAVKAFQTDGACYPVAPTGSMEPFLTGGDWVVVDNHSKYQDIQVGWMAVYDARWSPDHNLVCHWVAAKSGDEWIMDGQHNRHYESAPSQRMGKVEFKGRVIQVFKVKK